ncbi:tyrosine-type recombinase/integrase [Buttiauxella sp. S19-1]|uniref:tyrosine-type recombinase/integrase n=1 Tax=Buttiauxella sp. S19-1 TaxID=941430 RepID=UPI001EDA51F9|nr:integrase arm-type DNA-binding domain-containing protein [Buttiauxella sp. S19-1]
MALTDMTVRNAKLQNKAYKLTDSSGLFLFISPAGSKLWRFRYRFENKEQTFSIGPYPEISLSEARSKRDDARKLLANGINPAQQKREKKEEKANSRTFEAVAREWHKSNRKWVDTHAIKVLTSMETHVFPTLGKRDITELNTRDLLIPVKVVEAKGNIETATRLQQRITAIMRYAVQNAYITYNPAQDMSGAVSSQKSEHRPALPFDKVTELLKNIERYQGQSLTTLAINLALLTFTRSSEFRFARWSEIDLGRALWSIPPKRETIEGVKFSERGSKMGTEHLVPLCKQAVAILEQIHEISGEFDLIFIGDHNPYKPMSENTINKALRNMGYDTKTDICGHGFRAMACSAMIESGLWSKDAVERQMSHLERNSVRAAYTHLTKHMEERKQMMQWWADYLDANREGYVTPYEFANGNK